MSKKRARTVEGFRQETDKDFWEQLLKDEGLSMDAGRDPGHRKTVLVGNSNDLEDIHEMMAGRNGRVRPKGAGPDDNESL